jgi:peroxiredoxin Q/BCP
MLGAPIPVGHPAPEFHAKDHLGNEISLASIAGRSAVLVFYPANDTPG